MILNPKSGNLRTRLFVRSVALLTIAGLVLRIRNLDGPSLWLDELTMLSWSDAASWEESMSPNKAGKVMFGLEGLFYYIALNFMGDSDLALRSISAISGTILLVIIADFSRKEMGDSVGIMSISMLVASFMAVWYSQEGRVYMAATSMLWLAFLLIQDRSKNTPSMRFCVISLFAFCYLIHWFSGIVVLLGLTSRWIQLLFRTSEKASLKSVFSKSNLSKSLDPELGSIPLYTFAIISLGVFCIPEMFESNSSSLFGWISPTPDNPQIVLLDYIFGITSWTGGLPISWLSEALWLLILSSPIALLIHSKISEGEFDISQQPEWFLWVTGPGVLAIAVIYSEYSTPVFVPRYFLFSMPSWVILIATSTYRWFSISIELSEVIEKDVIKKAVSVFFAITILALQSSWLIIGWDYYGNEKKTDYEGMAIELDEMELSDEVIIISSPGGYLWNIYLERQGSNERIDSSPAAAYSLIEENKPNSVLYLLGTNTNSAIDNDFDSYLQERLVLDEIIYFHMGEIRIYGSLGVGN